VSAKRLILGGVALLLVLAGLLPIVVMLVKSFTSGGHFSLAAYEGLLASGRQWRLLGNSLALSLFTTFFATSLGLILGILFARTDLPCGRLFAFLFAIPLLLPPYITAVSWFSVLGREGLLARWLGSTIALRTSAWLFGLGGCVLVLSSTFLPVVMVLAITYLRTVDPRLEEAARLVARWPYVLCRITLPLARPGLVLAAMLVFLLSFGEFSVPIFLRYDVFPVESFTQFSAFYDFGAATAAAIPLAFITLLALLAEERLSGGKTLQMRAMGDKTGTAPIRLGSARPYVFGLVVLLCGVAVFLPLTVLFLQSLSAGSYREAIARAGDSLMRSLAYAVIGATVLAAVGFLAGYLVQSRALAFWRAFDFLSVFLFALPSTVIGIGLISLWNRPGTNFIYATPAIVLLGYLAQYTALSSRITVAALEQVPASMEEAAQIVGARWIRRVGWISVPMAWQGLVAAWLVAYIFCLRDTGITMVVYPPGGDTFPVRIFTLMANGAPSLIAALCVIMIVVALLPLGLLALVSSRTSHA
jgi:iron(III) transport system permease protein